MNEAEFPQPWISMIKQYTPMRLPKHQSE